MGHVEPVIKFEVAFDADIPSYIFNALTVSNMNYESQKIRYHGLYGSLTKELFDAGLVKIFKKVAFRE